VRRHATGRDISLVASPATILKFQTILCWIAAASEAQHLRGFHKNLCAGARAEPAELYSREPMFSKPVCYAI